MSFRNPKCISTKVSDAASLIPIFSTGSSAKKMTESPLNENHPPFLIALSCSLLLLQFNFSCKAFMMITVHLCLSINTADLPLPSLTSK